MASKLRAVIFDIDGTLIDSVPSHARAWQEIFARYGAQVEYEEVRKQIGKGGDQFMPIFLPADLVREKGEQIEHERLELFQKKYLPQIKPFPDGRELLERIRRDGLQIVLASSAKKDELVGYTKLANIHDILDDMTSSDDAERSKPHPDIFQAAMDKLQGIDVSEAIAVGDAPWDALAAGKIGLRTIGVLCGGSEESVLRDAGCIAVYRDPADLLAHYDRSPLSLHGSA